MFATLFFNLLLPVALRVLGGYINSSATNQDGKILDAIKNGAEYLAPKDNNTLTIPDSDYVNMAVMYDEVKTV